MEFEYSQDYGLQVVEALGLMRNLFFQVIKVTLKQDLQLRLVLLELREELVDVRFKGGLCGVILVI